MKFKQRLVISYLRTKFKLLSLVSPHKTAESAFRLFCTPYIKSRRLPAPIFNDAERIQFVYEAFTINGFRWIKAAAPKVLILHGFSSSVYNFDRYISAFTKKGYEVLAFDAPAHGLSTGKTVNAVQYAGAIKKIIDLFGPIKGFVSHSFGGLAVCLALEDIPHDEQIKIALIAPATETTSAIDGAFKMLRLHNKSVRKKFDEIIFRISNRATEWFSVRRAIRNIKADILWIHDEDDDVTPIEDALKVKEDNHANINFVITKGLGHHKIYRDKRTINLVTDFI
ncbi:MAG: alpha/beta hydrolase [Ferruginibacter sp.]